jgi:hypothetical protein
VNLNPPSGYQLLVRASDEGDQIRLIVTVRHRAVGALQASNRHPGAGQSRLAIQTKLAP